MPETDLALLTDAAQRAGQIAMDYFGQDPDVWDKGGGAGPVTAADLAVNTMLEVTLRTARPDYGWLSEETEDGSDRLSTTRQFVIDPIDGTRAFIEGSRDWGHSLAIVEDGQPVAAVVAMPARNLTFTAAIGEGAFCNGEAIHAATQTDMASATVLTAKPNLKSEFWATGVAPPFKCKFRSSLAYRLALVATGQFDAMLTLRPTWEWDIAAGALLVTEAGGSATTSGGVTLHFNNADPRLPGIVAAGGLHAGLIDALA